MFHHRPPRDYQVLPTSAERRRSVWTALLPRRSRAVLRIALCGAAAASDLVAIVATVVSVEALYGTMVLGEAITAVAGNATLLAGLLALVIVPANALRGEYTVDALLLGRSSAQRTVSLWIVAWGAVLVVGFATKTSADFSRAIAVLVFVLGLPALLLGRAWITALVRRAGGSASATASRVHLVGFEEDIAGFYARDAAEGPGLRVVGTSYLRKAEPGASEAERYEQLAEDLDLAVSIVRFLKPDDIFILVPWGDAAEVERCVDAFLRVPAALHLRPGAVLDRLPEMEVSRVGRLSGINVGRRPLNVGEVLLKRAVDLALALLALVALSPLFAAVALLIKVDSPGPVFFRQRRHGFNQQAFGVFKFRSMRTEANAAFRQATRNDTRITRIGAFLRRTNIDELPQLLNVVKGEMSLVGPRPHALAHDRSFERRIALYARRHNVRPGITGWAQVNGLRGETLTDLDMERRVQHDLHYIDNWSLGFDLQIMLQTLFSRKAYNNAF